MSSHCTKTAISFFLIALVISSVTAFQSQNGTCPEVEAMKDFDMNRFLGVWHVIQGTRIGNRLECMTFNLTRDSDAGIKMTQLPLNESSRLVMNDKKPSMMRIQLSDLVEAGFSVLVTDYDNFAGFFICRNEFGEKFLRAAAVLSRTHTLSDDQHNLVKDRLRDHGISDDDLTVVISCN